MTRTTTHATTLSVILLAGLLAGLEAGSARNLSWLQGKCPNGAAVAWCDKSESAINLFEVSTGELEVLESGKYAEFSPDGSKLAWVSGSTAKGRMRTGYKTVHVIATSVNGDGGIHWVSNTEVVVLKNDNKWYRVSLAGAEQDVPALTALGTSMSGEGVDVRLCDDGEWVMVNDDKGWKCSDGTTGSSPGSCSRSLSVDGRSLGGLIPDHDKYDIQSIRSGGYDKTVNRTLTDCGSKGFDNHRFSSNDPRFLVAHYECENQFAVWEISTSDVCVIASCGAGERFGDFTIGSGDGAPWPTGTVTPEMVCDQSGLAFSGLIGGAAPAAQSLDVYTSSGTLEGVSVSESAAWLSVSASGSTGQRIALTNSVAIASLTEGSYATTVTVASSNAGSTTYDVTLTVQSVPSLPALELTSPQGGEAFYIGQHLAVSWIANPDSLEQVDILLSTNEGEDWTEINAGGSVDAAAGSYSWEIPSTLGGLSLDGASCLLLLQDYNEGSGFRDMTGTAFSIAVAPALHLRYNCGADAQAVSGWDSPAAFATGGTSYDFNTAFSVDGIVGAAPAGVYRTVRHRIRNAETGFAYNLTQVPNGTYAVVLHFGDQGLDRAIDVDVEGIRVASDMDVKTAAGGTYTALVLCDTVTVADHNGLTISVNDDRADPADVFINGFEIISLDAEGPVISREQRPSSMPAPVLEHASGTAGIWCDTHGGAGTVRIVNLRGELALVRPLSGHRTWVPLHGLAPGIYAAALHTSRGESLGRIRLP